MDRKTKTTNGKVAVIATVLLLATGALAVADMPIVLDSIEPAPLSAAEEAGILFLREEEKLARDVYLALNDIWQYRVFENIARSEQQHMDSMLSLIDRYNLEDPALTPGKFTDPELQALYDTLVEHGAESLEEALRVGALIEEVDIEDLVVDMAAADNEDIDAIYDSLLRASYNHLRALVSQIDRFYDDYEEIIGSTSFAPRGPFFGRAAPVVRSPLTRGWLNSTLGDYVKVTARAHDNSE